MSYLSIISLAEAKNYLKLDDDLTADDPLITGMIKAAFEFLEKRTNHIMYARDVTYYVGIEGLEVYDYPINTVQSPTDYTDCRFSSRTRYYLTEAGELTLNVGYETVESVPGTFKQVALQIIDYWYYQNEKKIDNNGMPELLKQQIDVYRRFV
tara:strand:- start:923 stop:1381 length:459 start_codon:yes stop_codon:yes gene_type:complete